MFQYACKDWFSLLEKKKVPTSDRCMQNWIEEVDDSFNLEREFWIWKLLNSRDNENSKPI